MRKILFVLMVLVTSAAFGQGVRLKTNIAGFGGAHFAGVPPGYTKLNVRYEFVAMAIDSGLHVPQYNGTPSGVRAGVWVADGAIGVDTLNHRFYIYSGGAWVRVANYADIAASTPTWQQTLTAGSTLTGNNTIAGGGYDFTWNNMGNIAFNLAGGKTFNINDIASGSFFTANGATDTGFVGFRPSGQGIQIHNNSVTNEYTAQIQVGGSLRSIYSQVNFSSELSAMQILSDSIRLFPYRGNLIIDSLNYTLSTVGKKIMLRDTASGLVQNIDPALLTVSGVTAGSQGQIYQTSNGAAAWKYDTTTLVTFTAGANFAADTAAFTDSTIYGSFKLMGNDTFYVTGVSVVLYSNNAITDTLGIQITYNDTINVIGSHVFASTYAVNNGTTGQDADGDDFTGSNSVPIPPGNWVWLKSPTVVAGRKPYHMSVSIIGYKKRVN